MVPWGSGACAAARAAAGSGRSPRERRIVIGAAYRPDGQTAYSALRGTTPWPLLVAGRCQTGREAYAIALELDPLEIDPDLTFDLEPSAYACLMTIRSLIAKNDR